MWVMGWYGSAVPHGWRSQPIAWVAGLVGFVPAVVFVVSGWIV